MVSRTQKSIYQILIVMFFRLPFWALGIIAAFVMGAGYYLQVLDNDREARLAAALAEGPPTAVAITKFDESQHMNAAREVQVQAQPVLDYAYRLTVEGRGLDSHAFMIPLVSPTSVSGTEVVGIAYFRSPNEDFDNITTDLLLRGATGFGTVGPVITYNGKLTDMGKFDELTREAFADEGLQMPANPIVVWPYAKGRAVALAPREAGDLTIFGVVSKVAGAIGLFALAKLAFRRRDDDETELLEEAQLAAQQMQSGQAMYRAPADEIDYTVNGAGVAQEAYMVEDAFADATPRRSGLRRVFSGVRITLTFVFGLLFLVMLGNQVAVLLKESKASVQVAAVATPQEMIANTVADLAVPDADPNRHWTDIDVTPVIEWFMAKAMLAAAGDVNAMTTLAMIAGGVVLGPLLLLYFIRMRRSFTPKVSARIDSMGLN